MKLTAALYKTKNDTLRGWREKLSNCHTKVHIISWFLSPGVDGSIVSGDERWMMRGNKEKILRNEKKNPPLHIISYIASDEE